MDYKAFLRQELQPAFGCTEPIALAFAAAKAKELLGRDPERIEAKLSGNMIKNANSVFVPGTDGRKGIPISIVAGAFLGDPSRDLEVLMDVDKADLAECDKKIEDGILTVTHKKGVENLYIDMNVFAGDDSAEVIIENDHTGIIYMKKNDDVLLDKGAAVSHDDTVDLSFDAIYDFAKTCDYSDIKDILTRQMDYNLDIAEEGLNNHWGSNIGSTILDHSPTGSVDRYVAYAAAGSDARMSGCEKPVVINSGSGNQGITVTLPVLLYAKDHDIDEDTLYRGLIFSNLIALYMKDLIGKLSAYCGVVSASAASVCAIGFMRGDDKTILADTLTNALAVNSGVICDGAKASCAGKIASSLRNAFLAHDQALSHNSYLPGDGIVKDDIDTTIQTVATIAKDGMKVTDEVILEEMLEN
ncbi:L-serine ammonia-lyase, iron-sulfur-dependent, subunit alpha [Peptoniphilus equinus]|uniref:UPF0597 protein O6R05_07460 n=1 Tax=Peptoniphilus equinus TaxID=3016343 RepID=A0ABY7QU70_9FIRM|nr:L-serine ammonia-lyase, iron-sulfur-dependent, subunit alpha [Peptoniphilus equinus]WBW49830.1 L-serine ammonia-lyase, iron-sulfur-dependent, subunit alpha [Peptoniphilus equinus]